MMLMDAVKAAGRDVGAMSIEQSGIETMIRGRGFIRSVADVENIVIQGNAQQSALMLREGPRRAAIASETGERSDSAK